MANHVLGPRFLDSPEPFNPINPHGRKAKMPEGWKSPLRQPLYRVCVDWKGSPKPVAITPALVWEVAEAIQLSCKEAINAGHKPFWANPTVVLSNL